MRHDVLGIVRTKHADVFVPTQQTYECYMPRITGDLMMSNCQMLIDSACHEQYMPFGLLLTRTAAHFVQRLNVFSDNHVNGAVQ